MNPLTSGLINLVSLEKLYKWQEAQNNPKLKKEEENVKPLSYRVKK